MEIDRIARQILKALCWPMSLRPSRRGATRQMHNSRSLDPARAAGARRLSAQDGRAGDGPASETLREYPQHRAMLSFRSRNGEVEVHEKWADLFYVMAGRQRW